MQAFKAAVFFVDDGAHGPKPLGEAVSVRPARIFLSIGAVYAIQAFYFIGVISPRKAGRWLQFFSGGRRGFARYPSPNSIEKRFSNCLKGIGMALPLNLENYSVRCDFKGSGKEVSQVLADHPQYSAISRDSGVRVALCDLLGGGGIRRHCTILNVYGGAVKKIFAERQKSWFFRLSCESLRKPRGRVSNPPLRIPIPFLRPLRSLR